MPIGAQDQRRGHLAGPVPGAQGTVGLRGPVRADEGGHGPEPRIRSLTHSPWVRENILLKNVGQNASIQSCLLNQAARMKGGGADEMNKQRTPALLRGCSPSWRKALATNQPTRPRSQPVGNSGTP